MKFVRLGCFIVLIALLGEGCASTTVTKPPESATEQLLLSTSADRALAGVDLRILANRKVYVDTEYMKDAYHYEYAIGCVRDALSRAGALLDSNPTNCDIIVEARAGAISADYSSSLIGIPSTPAPVPLAGAVSLPEVALYKSESQWSYAKIALLAYANRSGAHVFSSGPLVGKAYDYYHKLLFISWVISDIPEKQKNPQKLRKFQTWYPQYDLTNLPPEAPAGHVSLTNSPPPAETNVANATLN